MASSLDNEDLAFAAYEAILRYLNTQPGSLHQPNTQTFLRDAQKHLDIAHEEGLVMQREFGSAVEAPPFPPEQPSTPGPAQSALPPAYASRQQPAAPRVQMQYPSQEQHVAGIDAHGHDVVGKPIWRFWPREYPYWFEGMITEYHPSSQLHTITYYRATCEEYEEYNLATGQNPEEWRWSGPPYLSCTGPRQAATGEAARSEHRALPPQGTSGGQQLPGGQETLEQACRDLQQLLHSRRFRDLRRLLEAFNFSAVFARNELDAMLEARDITAQDARRSREPEPDSDSDDLDDLQDGSLPAGGLR